MEGTRISRLFSGRRGSIRRRLLAWGLSLLGVSLVVNTLAGTIYTRRQIERSTSALQAEMASLTARRIHSLIQHKLERLQDTAVSMSLYPVGSEEQRLLGLLLLKNDRSFTELSVVDADAMERLKFSERTLYLKSDLKNQAGSPKVHKAIQHGRYIGPVYTSDRAEPYMTLAVPLKVTPSEVVGVVSTETNLKFLWEVIGESKFGFAGYAYVVDREGNLIAHQDPSMVLKKPNLRHLQKVQDFLRHPAVDLTPGQESQGIMGKPVLSTFAPVPELGWAVVLEEPLEAALGDLWTMRRYAFALLGMGLVLGAAIIAWASNRITEPIRQLRKGAEIIGKGNLEHRVSIETGDEIEELAEEFNRMTVALQTSHSTLERKVETRTQQLMTLYDVTTTVNQSLDVDTILQAVIRKITQIFHFDATRVLLFDAAREKLKLRASFETQPELWAQINEFKRGEGIVGRVAETGEPIVFEDIQTDPRYHQLSSSKATQKAKLSFFAVFPIRTKSRVFGTMVFIGKLARRMTEEEIRLLTSLADHLGVAVEKANLFEEVKTRSQHLAALNIVAATVSQSLDLQVMLKEALEKVADLLSFDAAWIYLLDPSSSALHLSGCKGVNGIISPNLPCAPAGRGIGVKVFETGRRLVFEDLETDPRYHELSSRQTILSLGFKSLGSFPVKAKERMVGVLHLASYTRRTFTIEELQLIESIAHEIGVGVENAQLFQEVREKTLELERINAQVQQASKAKSDFMAAMSHELRTPLNVIIGNADLTRDGFFGELNPDQKRALEKVGRYSRMLLKLINDVLALSRLEAEKMSLELSEVRVEEIINHAQTHVEQINRDHRLEVCWDVDTNIPRIKTDALKLEEILQNLIGNAFKFTPEGRIEVRVRNLQEAGNIEFIIADTGIGIEPENLGKIFDEFEQLKEAHTGNYQGVGLGLAIVKKYLELMQGDIRVESEPGRGSTFTFSLPHTLAS